MVRGGGRYISSVVGWQRERRFPGWSAMTDAELVPAGEAVDADVAQLVSELRDLYHASGTELMIRVGELILERLYGGDVTLWQSRRRKDVSFRKLQDHPDLPFRASMLSRS